MAKRGIYIIVCWCVAVCIASCDTTDGPEVAEVEAGEELSGGENFSTTDLSENAFGQQGKNVTREQEVQFVSGNALFRTNWVIAPASVQSLDGLGPMMNAISCGSCHFKDGRAKPPAAPGEALNGLLFRLSIPGENPHGAPLDDANYGGQLQDKAILGVDYEGKVNVLYQEVPGQYADGTSYTLRKPVYEFQDLKYGPFAAGILFSPRIAQQIPGLGLLESISETDILAHADEHDTNGDGISGRPNKVWDEEKHETVLGRFGWKANVPTLRQQTAGALNGDIGITSTLFPNDCLTPIQQALYGDVINGGDPEISDESLDKIVVYLKTLAVPVRHNMDDEVVRRGKFLFTSLQCAACHTPKMQTSSANSVAALNNQTIRPYTDLLLHDMGSALADNRPDFLATGSEWRTPPLWGLGMLKTVNDHTFLLHDGRARNIEEAILWHGGEAEKSKNGFTELAQSDREALIKFIESL